MRVCIDFVARILGFEEVDEFVDVGGGSHPFRRIVGLEVRLETKLLEAAVSDVLDVLVNIISIKAKNTLREEVAVISGLELDAFDDDILDFLTEFRGDEVGVFFKDVENEVDAELEVQTLVAQNPVDHGTEVA